jgi:hypothetical protein
MEVTKAIGPSFAQLRPVKDERTETFPVYDDLTTKLANAEPHPDSTVAHALATSAGYAYSTTDTVSMIMARMGLEENHCLMISQYVDAMFIHAVSFLIQSKDGRVVLLVNRGTEPLNFITWLTDLDVYPETVAFTFPADDELVGQPRGVGLDPAQHGSPLHFDVHAGFYRNVRSTRYEVAAALMRALDRRSILDDGRPMSQPLPNGGKMDNKLEALYITGHSLGGAMAAILAIMLVTDKDYGDKFLKPLRAVYTFGQPMIGSRELAKEADPLLGQKVFRYIYRRDVVPHLPPDDSGDFAHFGREYRSDGQWPWSYEKQPTRQLSNLIGLIQAPGAAVARKLRWFRNVPFQYSLSDHYPQNYISALTPPGVPSEFGDYYFATKLPRGADRRAADRPVPEFR